MALRIAIASGKGGTGKTTIAAALAYASGQNGMSTAYLDCDVEAPNGHIFFKPEITDRYRVIMPVPEVDLEKCTFCGECSKACQYNALAVLGEKVMVYPTLCHGCGACRIVCPERAIVEKKHQLGFINSGAGYGVSFWEGRLDVGQSLSPPLTRALKQLAPEKELIVIDAPPGSSCPVIEALDGCDFVVLVTEPTPLGLHDLKLAHGVAMKMGLPCGVIINRSNVGDDRTEEYCRSKDLPILRRIPFHRDIAETYARGDLVSLVDDGWLGDINDLCRTIQGEANGQRACDSQR